MIEMMSDALHSLLGLGREVEEIHGGQMVLLAVVISVFTLAIVRLGSNRFLGKATAFDVIIGIPPESGPRLLEVSVAEGVQTVRIQLE